MAAPASGEKYHICERIAATTRQTQSSLALARSVPRRAGDIGGLTLRD